VTCRSGLKFKLHSIKLLLLLQSARGADALASRAIVAMQRQADLTGCVAAHAVATLTIHTILPPNATDYISIKDKSSF